MQSRSVNVEMETVNPVSGFSIDGNGSGSNTRPVLDPIDVTTLGRRTYNEIKADLEWHANILKWTNISVLVFTLALLGIPAYLVRVLGAASGSLLSIYLVLAVAAGVNVVGVFFSICGQRRVCHE